MDDDAFDVDAEHEDQPTGDARDVEAAARLLRLFEEKPSTVFYGRQLEVLLEGEFFHWVTNRALRSLQGQVVLERHELAQPGLTTTLAWNRRYRYPRTQVRTVLALINRYVPPEVSRAVGDRGEELVLDGFAAQAGSICLGRNVRSIGHHAWTESDHNIDFVFERDGRRYGVEVKNTLAYLPKSEFDLKIRLAEALGAVPVFACRMLPKSWVLQLRSRGGFALILGFQLYPPLLRDLVDDLPKQFELPVDTPRRLQSGTMARFVNWHEKRSAENV